MEGFTSNVFLVPGEETVMVDAGSSPGVVEEVERCVDGLDAVVVTHMHRDHVGGLEAVLERFGAELYCAGEHPLRDRALSDGDVVRVGDCEFEVLEVPGHSADHVVLIGEEAVFTGDVVVYEDSAFSGGSFGRTDRPGQSREELVEGLRRLLDALPDTVYEMYPGHGPVFEGDVRSVVERALRRAERFDPKYPGEG